MDAIRANERLGWTLCGATSLGVFVAMVLLWRLGWSRRRLVALLTLVAVHPGWWMSARRGDCGFELREAAILMTVVAGIAVAMTLVVALVRRRWA